MKHSVAILITDWILNLEMYSTEIFYFENNLSEFMWSEFPSLEISEVNLKNPVCTYLEFTNSDIH